MNKRRQPLLSGIICGILLSRIASAQTATPPPAPMPVYTGSFGGGLALTGGNTSTKNYNFSFAMMRDPKTKNVVKFNALYLRGTQNDVLSVDKAGAALRDEYAVSHRIFVFGQLDYLRDEFKQIRYLYAPVGGAGYKLITNDRTSLSFSGGAGGIWEKDLGIPVHSSGDLNLGEAFSQKISSTAALTENVATLWKTNDFEDSLTNFGLGLTTSINKKLEVKIEFQDSYKNKPVLTTIKKNDTAFLTTFVLKF